VPKVYDRKRPRQRGNDLLKWLSVDLNNPRSQNLVPIDNFPQGIFQCDNIQTALNAKRRGNVVSRQTGIYLLQEPKTAL
jgi:hypothetical protein